MAEDSAKRGEITEMLKACSGGNREAMDKLIPLVYTENNSPATCGMTQPRRLKSPSFSRQAATR